jgi:hypothetical protein
MEYDNTGKVTDAETPSKDSQYDEPTDNDKELVAFVVDHTDNWREYRDQNYMEDWDKYERIWRGIWSEEDKGRVSERSRVISPATQQAIETRHAEIIEAVFGQGEFFDIKDDIADKTGGIDVEMLKNQLNEDFAQDKIRKAYDHIILLGEIYGTLIGELTVSEEKLFKPKTVPMEGNQVAYGVGEESRIAVKLVPVNPKNFLFDPNGTSVDDCMGVAIERYVSIHKIEAGIKSGMYRNVDITACYTADDALEPTQETKHYQEDKVSLMTYYGLAPKEYLTVDGEEIQEIEGISDEEDDYKDLVECIIVIADGSILLKAEESPYMMKDRPILLAQADTVPNRLLGRGTVEKAYNMQMAVDGSMRSHMDALALTVAPMIAMDATRLPRGSKFEVKPGKAFLVNGAPSEIIYPFKFGSNDGQAMQTSKEFERMLLMATGTIDSNGSVSQSSRDAGGIDMATATLIKKYKRVLVNIQEDFIIPFVNKATWRYMQFAPQRYPSVDVKFIPTAGLGIIAREYEQKQLAFLIQTLGAQSPLTPILMEGVLKNSSLNNREQMVEQMKALTQPKPEDQQTQQQAQQFAMQKAQKDLQLIDADIAKKNAETESINVDTQIAPKVAEAKLVAALSNNLQNGNEDQSFNQRVKIAELMLKEKDINSNEEISKMQNQYKSGQNVQ